MSNQLTLTCDFHIARQQQGRQRLRRGAAPAQPMGRVPRIARLMALAIRCEKSIREGIVADQSAFARSGHITTARMTQIMSLLNLAPDIQEQLLYLPRTDLGRDSVKETDIRPIANSLDWRQQRRMWLVLLVDKPLRDGNSIVHNRSAGGLCAST